MADIENSTHRLQLAQLSLWPVAGQGWLERDYRDGGHRQRYSPAGAGAAVSVAGGRPGIDGA